eukprot:5740404-Alexandrium_andersonii.AAC.1
MHCVRGALCICARACERRAMWCPGPGCGAQLTCALEWLLAAQMRDVIGSQVQSGVLGERMRSIRALTP